MSTFSLRVSVSHRELLRICLYLTPTMQYEYLSDPCFQDEQYTSFWALLLAKKVKKMTNTSDDTSWNLWVIFCLGHLLATCHLFIWRVATGPKRRAGSYFTTHFTTHFTNCLCYSWTKLINQRFSREKLHSPHLERSIPAPSFGTAAMLAIY